MVSDSNALPRGHDRGRFAARPRPQALIEAVAAGERRAADGSGWSGLLHVPDGVAQAPQTPAPFLLVLHGASSSGERMFGRWREAAVSSGLVVLAPDSEGATWDVLVEGYGADVARIDAALAAAFQQVRIDPRRCYIGGFSDGASYALSLGIANGDLFSGIVANSPGFCWPPCRVGRPRVLITHGRRDTVLPFDRTGEPLALQIEQAGYPVEFHAYDDGHTFTPAVLAWSLAFMGLASPETPA
jgi:phospholipase/carboxylesterase